MHNVSRSAESETLKRVETAILFLG